MRVAGDDLWGAATKAQTEPAGENAVGGEVRTNFGFSLSGDLGYDEVSASEKFCLGREAARPGKIFGAAVRCRFDFLIRPEGALPLDESRAF